MSAETLLSRLEKVKRSGTGSWLACCPAHADKTPSLTIREVDDGRVLLHCFGGCSVEEVLGAVSLGFDALFPPKPIDGAKPLRRPFPAADVLEALSHETGLVAIAACRLARGERIEAQRLLLAAERIEEGRRLANG